MVFVSSTGSSANSQPAMPSNSSGSTVEFDAMLGQAGAHLPPNSSQEGSGNGGAPSGPASQHIGSGEAPSSAPAAALPPHKQQIDAWLADNDDPTPEEAMEALQGGLKDLSPADQRYLVDRVLPKLSFTDIGKFASAVSGNASLRGPVGEGYLKRALQLQKESVAEGDSSDRGRTGENHLMARAFADNLLVIYDGAYHELGAPLSSLTKADSALFAQTFTGSPPQDPTQLRARLDEFQAALKSARAPDPAAEARRLDGLFKRQDIIKKLYGDHVPEDAKSIMRRVIDDPRVSAQLPNGPGNDWARNPIVARVTAEAIVRGDRVTVFSPAEMKRVDQLAGILTTEGGQQLFLTGKAPGQAKADALEVLAAHPEITKETFERAKSAWPPELASAIAKTYQVRDGGGELQKLTGAFGVENMVGPWMGMKPTWADGAMALWGDQAQEWLNQLANGQITPKQFAEKLSGGNDLLLYGQKSVKVVADKIRERADTDPPRVIPIHVTLVNEFGPIQCPLFGVETGRDKAGKPILAYVDNTGRAYDNFQDWVDTNHLPEGTVYYPEGGIPKTDANGEPVLVSSLTPESRKSRVAKAIDSAALVGCLAAGAVAFVATGPVALVAGGVAVAGGLWQGARSAQNLVDHARHGGSLASLEMLPEWCGVIGGITGAGGYVGALKGASLAASGVRLGEGAALAFRAAGTAASAANYAGLASQAGILAVNWKEMSPDERKDALGQLLLFAGLAAAHHAMPKPAVGRSPHTVEAEAVPPRTPPAELPRARVVKMPPEWSQPRASKPAQEHAPASAKPAAATLPANANMPKGVDPAKRAANTNAPRDSEPVDKPCPDRFSRS